MRSFNRDEDDYFYSNSSIGSAISNADKWYQDFFFCSEISSVSSIEYDPFFDVYWIGYSNGRLSSFKMKGCNIVNNFKEAKSGVELEAYSSFLTTKSELANPSSHILSQIHPNQRFVISLSDSTIGIYSYGGLSYGAISSIDLNIIDDMQQNSFTCGTLLRPIAKKDENPVSPTIANYFLVGTGGLKVFLYDLSRVSICGRDYFPALTYSVRSPTVKAISNGHVVALAGKDGCISLLDAKLRSSNVIASIEGHAGSVNDIALDATDGGRTLYSCGFSRRAINPYDSNSPFQYFCDPVIRTYDLRMHRQLASLTIPMMPIVSSSGVRFIRFMQPDLNKSSSQSSANPYLELPPSLLLCTEDGIVQINEIKQSGGGGLSLVPREVFFAPLSNDRPDSMESITAVAAASTGNFVSIGMNTGGVVQYCRDGDLKVNPNSLDLKSAPSREFSPPPLSLAVDAIVLGTAYTLCHAMPKKQKNKQRFKDTDSFLSSSFATTPTLYTQKLRLTSLRRIHEDLKVHLTKQDFIGTIPNPEFYPNSMIYGKLSKKAYAVCDPRKQISAISVIETAQNRQHLSPSVEERNSTRRKLDSCSGLSTNSSPIDIPAHFRRQKGPRGKQRIKKFEFSRYNETAFIGLENNFPNSYANAILQLLYSLPLIRNEALRSQTYIFQHMNQSTLWCELGFLFHMLLSVQQYFSREDVRMYAKYAADSEPAPQDYRSSSFSFCEGGYVDKVVQPGNFQRTFQLVPEAVALGLFDSGYMTTPGTVNSAGITGGGRSHSGSTLSDKEADILQTAQTFMRFILTQLNKELFEADAASNRAKRASTNVIDRVFGFYVKSCTTFLNSGVTETASNAMQSLSLELIYPSANSPKPPHKQSGRSPVKPGENGLNKSFSFTLWASLQKETFMKGWCSASETYEPFKQVRSIISLPQVLAILCGETKKEIPVSVDQAQPDGKARWTTIHAAYWASNEMVIPKCDEDCELQIFGCHQSSACTISYQYWLPQEVEVAFVNPKSDKGDAERSKLIISSRIKVLTAGNTYFDVWIIYDGSCELIAASPASERLNLNSRDECAEGMAQWIVETFDPIAVASQILSSEESQVILHVKIAEEDGHPPYGSGLGGDWYLFNDFLVKRSDFDEALRFPSWRHPCVVCFRKRGSEAPVAEASFPSEEAVPEIILPESVLAIPSLSQIPCVKLVSKHSANTVANAVKLPDAGDLIAFDGEFVTVALEQSEVSANGQRVVSEEGRQILARMSLLHGGKPSLQCGEDDPLDVLADDYILPMEPVLDYVTRFSGIVAEDLNPVVSKHAVLTHRAAYLKLRYFIDRKFIFVGHGLQKDFETANIFVPPEQIFDTVELWRLPNQRKISLRFLASYLLKQDIQDEVHDSIEDAKTALQLYRHYQRVSMRGPDAIKGTLNDLYSFGHKNDWTIGFEKIPIT